MKVMVSSIRNRALRRAVIVGTYPLAVIGCMAFPFWNLLVDLVCWQIGLARSAREEWRK